MYDSEWAQSLTMVTALLCLDGSIDKGQDSASPTPRRDGVSRPQLEWGKKAGRVAVEED
jgi:hypothetical protein